MNTPNSFIDTYGIKEVHADVGESMQTNEFFVYKSEEIPVQEKMFRPSRSTHYAIHLNLGDVIEVKYNLINYNVQKKFSLHHTSWYCSCTKRSCIFTYHQHWVYTGIF